MGVLHRNVYMWESVWFLGYYHGGALLVTSNFDGTSVRHQISDDQTWILPNVLPLKRTNSNTAIDKYCLTPNFLR